MEPPIPFQGDKGRWVKYIRWIARRMAPGTSVFCAYGGSGIDAHIAKQANPKLVITINDADNYTNLLDHYCDIQHILQHIITKKYNKQEAATYISQYYPWAEADLLVGLLAIRGNTFGYDFWARRALPPMIDNYLYGIKKIHKIYKKTADLNVCDKYDLVVLDPPYSSPGWEVYRACQGDDYNTARDYALQSSRACLWYGLEPLRGYSTLATLRGYWGKKEYLLANAKAKKLLNRSTPLSI